MKDLKLSKEFAHLSPAAQAALKKRLTKLAESDHLFPGYLGNKNSFFIAKPEPRRRKTAKRAKVVA
ncbi:hypothetical protein [Prosthecobacter sp.]|jgi:hypothetical protein|uniref:hypothetical protein n=1 Tax=Prosthecobacter sp. TaxID=1965333 RepID=UPI00378354A2